MTAPALALHRIRTASRDTVAWTGIGLGPVVAGFLVAASTRLAALAFAAAAFGVIAFLPMPAVLFAVTATRNGTDAFADRTLVAGLNPSALLGMLVIGLAVLHYLIGHTRQGGRFLVWSGLLLTASFLDGVWLHGTQPSLVRELIRSASVVALAYLAYSVALPALTAVRIVIWGTAPAAVLVIASTAQHFAGFDAGGFRSRGMYSHPNVAAAAFAISVVLVLWRARTSEQRTLYRGLAGLFFLALLCTGSMGGLAQTFVGVVALSVMRAPGTRRRLKLVLLAAAVCAGFAATPLGQARLQELNSTKSFDVAASGHISNSLDWRFLNWAKEVDAWKEHPLFGHGLGTTVDIVVPLGNLTHNDYLRLLLETGIVGVFVGLLVVFMLWRGLAPARAPAPLDQGFRVVCRALLLGLATHALVTNVSLATAPEYGLALLIGAALATGVRARESVA